MLEQPEWDLLDIRSPSGKMLFQCKACGHVSYGPDKRCGGCQPYSDEEVRDAVNKLKERQQQRSK